MKDRALRLQRGAFKKKSLLYSTVKEIGHSIVRMRVHCNAIDYYEYNRICAFSNVSSHEILMRTMTKRCFRVSQ